MDLRILKDLTREIVELYILSNLAAPERPGAEGSTPTPDISDVYQNKGLTKFDCWN